VDNILGSFFVSFEYMSMNMCLHMEVQKYFVLINYFVLTKMFLVLHTRITYLHTKYVYTNIYMIYIHTYKRTNIHICSLTKYVYPSHDTRGGGF